MRQKIAIFLFFSLFISSSAYFFSFPAYAYHDLETDVEVLVSCGDGWKDPTEACDPGNPAYGIPPDLASSTCHTYGYKDGFLKCNDDCSAILTNMCNTCGNGIKEGREQCDVSDFGGYTCASFGYNNGTLECVQENLSFPGLSPPGCLWNLSKCFSVGLDNPTSDSGSKTGGGGGGGGSRGGGSSGLSTGFDPGSDTPPDTTKVIIKGKGYPNTDLHILLDGKVFGLVKTDAKADFTYESTDIPPGVASISLWSEDRDTLRSTLLTLTLRVITGAITTISGAYISPTIDLDKKTVKKGEQIVAFGQTAPVSQVLLDVDNGKIFSRTATSTDTGKWTLNIDTSNLKEEQYHFAKSLFQTEIIGGMAKSAYSRSVNFLVGTGEAPTGGTNGDLNNDKRVNLTDFSILLFNWGKSSPVSDLNKNGKVDLADFSIMMFNWTG